MTRVRESLPHVQRMVDNVALIDLLQSLAQCVHCNRDNGMEFTTPVLAEHGPLCIVDGVSDGSIWSCLWLL